MANGNGVLQNGNRRVIGTCIAITLALNTPTFFILNEHWTQFSELKKEIAEGTKDRYYRRDALAHEAVDNQKFENVYFRFARNEAHIAECLEHVKDHP